MGVHADARTTPQISQGLQDVSLDQQLRVGREHASAARMESLRSYELAAGPPLLTLKLEYKTALS